MNASDLVGNIDRASHPPMRTAVFRENSPNDVLVPAVAEALECRRMFDALTYTGTPGDDTIVLKVRGDILFWEVGNNIGQVQFGPEITMLRINGLGGDDTLTVEAATTMPAEINGGDGEDVLSGGAGVDTIRGGDHNDVLWGGSSGDYMYGESGNDIMGGELGGDYMDGGSGEDNISGGADGDYLQGGPDADVINGDGGDDFFYSTWDGAYDQCDGGEDYDSIAEYESGLDVLSNIESGI